MRCMYSSSIHSLEKSTIKVNSKNNRSLSSQINVIMLENRSKHHTKRKIPTRDHERIRSHIINEQFWDVNLSTALKTVNEEWCKASSMAEFTGLGKDVMRTILVRA